MFRKCTKKNPMGDYSETDKFQKKVFLKKYFETVFFISIVNKIRNPERI